MQNGERRSVTATGMALLVALASVSVADDRAFLLEPPALFEGSPGVVALTESDFDGDGDVDIAASIPAGPEILVYQNLEDGRLERHPVTTAGAHALAAADLDNDGVTDLAMASSGTISVSYGAGGGGFLEPVGVGTVQDPSGVTVGDVDQDGLTDLIVPIRNFCDCVHLYLNAGERSFEEAAILSTSRGDGGATNPSDAVLFDLDSDGWLDLAVATYNAFQVYLFPNLGEAPGGGWSGLGDRQDLRLDGHQTSIAAGDLDGDGLGELAVLFSLGISVLPNVGSEGFGPPQLLLATEREPQDLLINDLDRDVNLDLVIADTGASRVIVALNDSRGGFKMQSSDRLVEEPTKIVAADFDGEGAVDLASTHRGVALFLNTLGEDCNQNDVPDAVDLGPTLAFMGPEIRALFRSDGKIAAGDADGDGDLEIVLGFPTDRGFPPGLSVLPNRGDGTFEPPIDQEMEPEFRSFLLGDVDGDGKLDVLANLLTSVRTLLGDGTGRFQVGPLLPDAGSFNSPLMDLDADGDLDLVAAVFRTDAMVILLNDGAGTFTLGQRLATPSTPWEAQGADFDGDGQVDLAVANRVTRNVAVFRNDGAATFTPGRRYVVGDLPSGVAAADLDEDGDVDLAVSNHDSNDLSLLWNEGTGLFAPAVPISLSERSGGAAGIKIVDLDLDGRLDLFVSAGAGFYFLGRGQGAFSTQRHTPAFISNGPFALADLDGDADLDVSSIPYAGSPRDDLFIVRNERRSAVSADCDRNGIPDECDLASGPESDRNANGTLDACETSPWFHRGDADDDGRLSLADGILVIDHVLRGRQRPSCRDAADTNGDERLDIADPVSLFNYLFRSGPQLPPPGSPDGPCGPDDPPEGPRGDLGCEVYSSC